MVAADSAVASVLVTALGHRWLFDKGANPPQPVDLLSLAVGDATWDAVSSLASVERTGPLLYALVRGSLGCPTRVERALHDAYAYSAVQNRLRPRELTTVLAILHDAGVSAIILKGAALASAVYDDIAVRPMSDLDILVLRQDVEMALDCLAGRGWAAKLVEPRPGMIVGYENEIILVGPRPASSLLELHWGLLDSPHHHRTVDAGWLWRTAQPAQLGGVPALILGPEAQLLHLCAHLALHHGRGDQPVLLWQHDIAELLHVYRDRLDWEVILAKAQVFDLVLPLQQVLGQVLALWPAPVPEDAWRRLAHLRPSPAEAAVFQRLTQRDRPVLRRLRDDLSALPDWRSRVVFALANLFPTPAYMRQRYDLPQGLPILLSYPYRWAIGLQEAIAHRRTRR